MKGTRIFSAFLAALCLASCDESTSTLGTSITPEEDRISITSENIEIDTRSVICPDSLLARTSTCYLGRYTDPYDSTSFSAGYLTQINCVESFNLPDSIYGISDFVFPLSTHLKWKDVDPYYSNIRLYFSGFFGDSLASMKIEVFELDKMIDANSKYYADTDPGQFVSLDKEPLVSLMFSPVDLGISDEDRNNTEYYPNVYIRMPQEFTKALLEKYYQPGGREFFTSSKAFMENVCKGFYIRCTQGEGNVLYIDRTVLEVNHKSIMYVDGEPRDTSLMSDFSGNSEVMQINCFKWEGREKLMSQNDCSWIQSPYGILTQVTLPIDSMVGKGALNSAQATFTCMPTPQQRFKPSVPTKLAMVSKSGIKEFFESSAQITSADVFIASYASKTSIYQFSNIAPLAESIASERTEWLKENGMEDDEAGKAAYSAANPDWDKVYLIPVSSRSDGSGSLAGYYLDMSLHRAKLSGGENGEKPVLKIIRTAFK